MNERRKNIIVKLLRIISRYKISVILTLLLAVVQVGFSLYIPIAVGNAVDCMLGKNSVDFNGLGVHIFRILISIAAASCAQWTMNLLNNRISFNTVRDLRKSLFEKLTLLPIGYIDSHKHGDFTNRMINDTDTFSEGLLMGFTQLFTGIMTIIGTLVFMVSLNPSITVMVIVLTPLSLFAARFISSRTFDMFTLQSRLKAEQTALFDEYISNQKTVKVFSYENDIIDRHNKINSELSRSSLKAVFFSSLTNPVTRFVNYLVYMTVALVGAFAVLKSPAFTVGTLVTFLSYANQYTKPFNEISGVIAELQNALACAGRVFDLLETKNESQDENNPETVLDSSSDIAFNNVSFNYPGGRPILKSLDTDVKNGMKIAIVGPTGCGKTTMINLLMRFYDPVNGKITFNGVSSTDLNREAVRRSFGMVLQETWLKSATVKENILMGKPGASDSEIINAAVLSGADPFIRKLPDGYDTVIGENGFVLSEGQRQLLCISRVMLMDPPMLILDEATSSVDTRTELKIQDAFDKLMENKTAFIVAHRLSTVRNADLILVMNDGMIVESGRHEELLKKRGSYYELYQNQFSSVLTKNPV